MKKVSPNKKCACFHNCREIIISSTVHVPESSDLLKVATLQKYQ